MKLKVGGDAEYGDVIRWNVWDNEDFVLWNMLGVYLPKGVIYLTGGLDHGTAIGSLLSIDKVIAESEDNDAGDQGITKVGVVTDLVNYISLYDALRYE